MTKADRGKVYLVGAGPGDPELLTVKASALLRSAELVLHDDLVPAAITSLAAPHAIVINVGKRCGAKSITQEEINGLMIDSARRGMSVVRLKGGDPLVFGRLAEELDALDAAEVPWEVVPGITAGFAAAASLGASLTDRRTNSRILIVSSHHAHGKEFPDNIDWRDVARRDTTLVVYMPGKDLNGLSRSLLEAGLPPDTPCVVVSQATTTAQHQFGASLRELHTLPPVEPPAILLIGRSLERALRSIRLGNLVSVNTAADWETFFEPIGIEASSGASGHRSERRIIR
ncbi:MAG: uroporphyrinogen-III C-methyltransferase [Candidatus Acidiferrales bacterium]